MLTVGEKRLARVSEDPSSDAARAAVAAELALTLRALHSVYHEMLHHTCF